MKPEIQVLDDPQALYRRAAEEFILQSNSAVNAKNSFSVALSGGSTPRGLYSLLADDPFFRNRVPWPQIQFFWSDERHVPPGDLQSNYRLAFDAMLSKVPVPGENIHRVRSELSDAFHAAEEYNFTLHDCFKISEGQLPRFDLLLLGMGPDGHTASLFPGTEALLEHERLAVANWVEKLHAWRITLTLPVINNAACVLFLVSGEEKAEMLKKILTPGAPIQFPAQLVNPTNGRFCWLLDRSAASLLQA